MRNFVRLAEDLKTLTEQRAELVQKLKDIDATAEAEQRAFSDEEDDEFEKIGKQIEGLDSTIAKIERARDLGIL